MRRDRGTLVDFFFPHADEDMGGGGVVGGGCMCVCVRVDIHPAGFPLANARTQPTNLRTRSPPLSISRASSKPALMTGKNSTEA